MIEVKEFAVAIIGQAYADMQGYDPHKGIRGKKRISKEDYESADDFFCSEWFEVLADASGADKRDILEKVNKIRQTNLDKEIELIGEIKKSVRKCTKVYVST